MIKTFEKSNHFNFFAVVLLLLISFQAVAQLSPKEGFITVKGGKLWYKIVGSGNKTPLLLLHGGPGSTSYYLNPLDQLAADRPVIFFDQLGCGRSSSITDTSLMTIDNYVDELEQLKNALGITDYFLYGHSWGTMLGIDYYLKHPEGIKAIIFGSPLFSTDLWIKDAQLLIKTLPDSVQQTISINEQYQSYSSQDYKRAVEFYYRHFLRRTEKHQADMDSTYKFFGNNVYEYMWGPSEFKATGTLKNFNRLKELQKVKVPVLLTCGGYDEARPSTVKYYQALLPGSELVVIKNSGHMTMIDNTEDNNKAIANFLIKIEHK